MKNFIMILSVITMILSCKNLDNTKSLKSDLILNDFYSTKEIYELDKILSFVDNEIIKRTNINDIDVAYHDFFEKFVTKIKNSDTISSIINEKDKYIFLQSLDTNVFNSIFSFQRTFNRINYKDTVLIDFTGITSLNLQPFDRYVKYLKKQGEINNLYRDISDMIEMAGDFSASFAQGYPINHSKFDFKNETDRLFAAIFILRLEDNIYIKLDRYFENINATQHAI